MALIRNGCGSGKVSESCGDHGVLVGVALGGGGKVSTGEDSS